MLTEGRTRPLNAIVLDEAYHLAQEALSNAFSHSNAKNIEVDLIYGEDFLVLRFRDDGTGIDDEILRTGPRSGHWGLLGMRERAENLGGRFELRTQPLVGTEVAVTLPYDLQEARR